MILLLSPLREVLFGRLSLLTYFVFLLFVFLPAVIINYRLFADTLFGDHSASFKVALTSSLLGGSLLRFSNVDLLLVLITGLLLGINISLVFLSVQTLQHAKKLSFSVGGIGLISLVASGCASCGISILSLVGISFAFLPFHGVELTILSIGLLSISLITQLITYKKACTLKTS